MNRTAHRRTLDALEGRPAWVSRQSKMDGQCSPILHIEGSSPPITHDVPWKAIERWLEGSRAPVRGRRWRTGWHEVEIQFKGRMTAQQERK